jgi:hypothetical protein
MLVQVSSGGVRKRQVRPGKERLGEEKSGCHFMKGLDFVGHLGTGLYTLGHVMSG